MLEYLQGRIIKFLPKAIIIDLNGLGMRVVMGEKSLKEMKQKHSEIPSEVQILTYLNIQENKWEIYGFSDETERSFFLILLNCRGIGPKGALSILDTLTPEELYEIASGRENYARLQQAPGVGAKSAQRIAIELKNHLAKMEEYNFTSKKGNDLNSYSQADLFKVLQNLGYRTSEIQIALSNLSPNLPVTLAEAVRELLKILGKG